MKTLQQILTTYTDEQLTAVLRLWIVEEPIDKKRTMVLTALQRQMHENIAARFVWDKLSANARALLYRAVNTSARYGIAHDELRKKAQLSSEEYQVAITELTNYALLQEDERAYYNAFSVSASSSATKTKVVVPFHESMDSLYATGRELFTPSGDRSKKNLNSLLSQASEAELYQLMRAYEIESEGYYTRADLRDIAVEEMLKDDNLLDHLPNLDSRTRLLINFVRESGGKVIAQTAREKLHFTDAMLLNILRTLAKFALVFDTFSGGKHVLFMPNDLYMSMLPAANASKMAAKAKKVELIRAEKEPTVVHGGEPISVYDVATLVGIVYQQRIEPTQAGKVPKRIAAKIRPLLRGQARKDYMGEDEYLEILLDMMTQLGLVQLAEPDTDQSKSAYVPGPHLDEWSHFSLPNQTSRLARFWLDHTSWHDVYGVHYKPATAYNWDTSGGRGALIRHLATCTPNRWYTIPSLLDILWEKDAFAFRPQNSYYPQKMYRKTDETRAIWNLCEGEVYTGILASTLNELGIVSVGYSQGEALLTEQPANPDLFMVTELGDKVLKVGTGLADSSLLESQESQMAQGLVVQPNFELLLLQPDLVTLYNVLPFAQVNQLGLVSRLTLTKASVIRGLTMGKTTAQIMEALREQSQKELPQNVEYTLLDWTKSYRDVGITQVLLLEVSHEDVIPRLKAIAPLKEMVLRQLGPTILAVQGEVDMSKLRKALEKEGIVVRVNGDIFVRPKQPHYYDYSNFGRY